MITVEEANTAKPSYRRRRGDLVRLGRPRASATIFSPLLLIVAEDIEGEPLATLLSKIHRAAEPGLEMA